MSFSYGEVQKNKQGGRMADLNSIASPLIANFLAIFEKIALLRYKYGGGIKLPEKSLVPPLLVSFTGREAQVWLKRLKRR